jgi:error-prone DNA polymerase
MTDLRLHIANRVPNTRSPGTPVCHPDDDYQPPAAPPSASIRPKNSPSNSAGSANTASSANTAFDHEYIELHASSAFSFLDGASQPEALITRAAELEMPALALADRNGLYGVARFHTAARRSGVRAHVGAEIAVSGFGSRLTPPAWLPHQCPQEPPRVLLLCASQAGYQNLSQLITRFKMRETTKAEGAATLDDLEEFSSGLLCLTGGEEGPLAAALAHGGAAQARQAADRLASIYGRGNLYIELQRHHERQEECRNQALLGLAASLGLPLIATNGVRYAVEKDRELLDVFT